MTTGQTMKFPLDLTAKLQPYRAALMWRPVQSGELHCLASYNASFYLRFVTWICELQVAPPSQVGCGDNHCIQLELTEMIKAILWLPFEDENINCVGSFARKHHGWSTTLIRTQAGNNIIIWGVLITRLPREHGQFFMKSPFLSSCCHLSCILRCSRHKLRWIHVRSRSWSSMRLLGSQALKMLPEIWSW